MQKVQKVAQSEKCKKKCKKVHLPPRVHSLGQALQAAKYTPNDLLLNACPQQIGMTMVLYALLSTTLHSLLAL